MKPSEFGAPAREQATVLVVDAEVAEVPLALWPLEALDENLNTLGQVGVMAKPFELIELINNVHRLLSEVAPMFRTQPRVTQAIAGDIANWGTI